MYIKYRRKLDNICPFVHSKLELRKFSLTFRQEKPAKSFFLFFAYAAAISALDRLR